MDFSIVFIYLFLFRNRSLAFYMQYSFTVLFCILLFNILFQKKIQS